MTLGLLILRVVMGLTLAAHGSQKLFGWFEGPGRAGTAGMFTKLGFRWPTTMALLAGAAEFFGGLLFALGLLTPFAAIALVVVMLNAIIVVHWQKSKHNHARSEVSKLFYKLRLIGGEGVQINQRLAGSSVQKL